MKVAITIALTMGAVLTPLLPSPLDTRFGSKVTITTPVNGDVYLAANTVTIDAPIRGDLVVAAGTLIVNDSVMQDILVAAGNVVISGYVGDDVRAAGGSITLSGEVGGDVVSGSGELVFEKGSTIHGNLAASGGLLDIFGYVKGNVDAMSENLDLSATVDGDLNARAKDIEMSGTVNGYSAISANNIRIVESASFGKDVRYWNDEGTLDIPRQANGVNVTYDPAIKVEQERWELLGYSSVLMVLWYLGTALIVIWLIEYLFSKTMLRAAGVALQQSLGSIGYGIVFLVGVPIVIVGLAITVLALPIAIILAIAYGIVVVSATAITAIIISNWLNKVYYHSSWNIARITLAAFGIFIVLKFFTLTPIIGPMLMVIMACMALGAIVISVWNARRDLKTKAIKS